MYVCACMTNTRAGRPMTARGASSVRVDFAYKRPGFEGLHQRKIILTE